jgi:hypothetical protein
MRRAQSCCALICVPRSLLKVSKVVLTRFVACGEINVYDRQRNVIYSKGSSHVFTIEFDIHEPPGSGQRWSDVETKMPFVYQLLDRRETLDEPDSDLLCVRRVRPAPICGNPGIELRQIGGTSPPGWMACNLERPGTRGSWNRRSG